MDMFVLWICSIMEKLLWEKKNGQKEKLTGGKESDRWKQKKKEQVGQTENEYRRCRLKTNDINNYIKYKWTINSK